MRNIARRRNKRIISDINVVPYIDVMLVLLVIFMVTAPLLQQGVEVELPQGEAQTISLLEEEEPIILTIDRQGNLYLNIGGESEKVLDNQIVVARVSAALRINPRLPVLVRGDAGVPYNDVMQGMILLQRAGAGQVGLMTDIP